MQLLVLGGTAFVGRHVTSAALARGHEVTHFNRGRTAPNAFSEVRTLRGDRDGDLASLARVCRRERWDAVVDTSGYVPRIVGASLELLRDCTEHYTFVSSVSVYADLSRPGVDESAPLSELDDPSSEELPAQYGPLKVACERLVEDAFGARALIARPGLIVGPHDPTDRFTYWPVRLARGGEVLAPAPPEQPVQWIDARDLAEWIVRLAEAGTGGRFNVVGPGQTTSFASFLAGCAVTGVATDVRWLPADRLHEQGVGDWIDLPLWISKPHAAGLLRIDGTRALAAGLRCRQLEETARDTLAWARTRSPDHVWEAGLSAERERTVLGA